MDRYGQKGPERERNRQKHTDIDRKGRKGKKRTERKGGAGVKQLLTNADKGG